MSVVTAWDVPFPWSVRVTAAPGTAAPDGSRTVPRMVPVVTCACRVVAAPNTVATNSTSERRFASLIVSSLGVLWP